LEVFRLNDDSPLAAIEFRAPGCVLFGRSLGTPLYIPVAHSNRLLLGHVDPTTGRVSWSPQWIPIAQQVGSFAWDGGFGVAFYDGTIKGLSSTDASSFSVLDPGPIRAPIPYGRGTQVVYAGQVGAARRDIRTVVGTSSPQELEAMADADAQSVTLSSDKLVWVGTHGPSAGPYDAAEFYWSPLATRPQDVQVHMGASIPAQGLLSELSAWGDYAATIGNLAPDFRTYVVVVTQISTGKVWTLKPAAGTWFSRVLLVSPSEVVVLSDDWATANTAQRLLRLDLSRLDDLAAGPIPR
jgi:hypothetical protein